MQDELRVETPQCSISRPFYYEENDDILLSAINRMALEEAVGGTYRSIRM
jgi:hypothetical protein